MNKDECCPKFNPKHWDNKIFNWKNKKFIQSKVFTFFYIPLNFGSVVNKLIKKIDSVNAKCPNWLMLSEHTSKWNMNLFLAVDKEIPNTENITIKGKFFSKVYEGQYKEINKFYLDYENYTKNKNLKITKQYMWYTTCPKCAKKYGKNYMVIIGELN